MNAVKEDVEALVEKELLAANERYPLFHSPHEGYAVMLEEYDEAKDALDALGDLLGQTWEAVKGDNAGALRIAGDALRRAAMSAACEHIQVAAMARKFEMSRRAWDES